MKKNFCFRGQSFPITTTINLPTTLLLYMMLMCVVPYWGNISFIIFDDEVDCSLLAMQEKRVGELLNGLCMIVQSHLKTITRAIMRVLNGDNSTEEAAFFNFKTRLKTTSLWLLKYTKLKKKVNWNGLIPLSAAT